MVKIKSKLFLFFSVIILMTLNNSVKPESQPQMSHANQIIKSLNALPLYFIENKGQVNERVKYQLKIPQANVFFAQDEIVYQFLHRKDKEKTQAEKLTRKEKARGEEIEVKNIRVRFVGSNERVKVEGIEESETKVSYFRGNDPRKWLRGVRTFQKVRYRELYPHIDLIVYGNGWNVKHEYRVRIGGEVEKIRVRYEGVKRLRLNKMGQLEIEIEGGVLVEDTPLSYQIVDGEKVGVETEYVIDRDNLVRFKLEKYRKDRELVIDPSLIYSTYLGGSVDDGATRIVVDGSGNAYVTGSTWSSDFPTTSGAYNTSFSGDSDVFITKLNSSGTSLLYSTYLGGSSDDRGIGIAVDGSGNAYVTGWTESSDFPTTSGAYDISYNGNGFWGDVFITKLNSSGTSLLYSTYLGGSSDDRGIGIAVDGSGNAYVTGSTESSDFLTTAGAYDTSFNGGEDVFITKLNSSGTSLLYSTYLGGSDFWDSGSGIAVDGSGNAYVTGETWSSDFPTTLGAYDNTSNTDDVRTSFITKLNSSGTSLLYSTYLGGSVEDSGSGIAVDGSGNAYVTGFTWSSDFPTTPGAYDTSYNGDADGFITKLNSAGTSLLYSTYLGGSVDDWSSGIAIDGSGNVYVIGMTSSSDFPTTAGAYDTSFNGGWVDGFIMKLNSSGTSLLYSTYLGGSDFWDSGNGIAVDGSGYTYVTGSTWSSDFPTTAGAYDISFDGDSDGFITKLCLGYSLTISSGTGGTTDPSSGTYCYDTETEVTITAIPESGYRFSEWNGDISGTDNPLTITMDSNKSIKANFTKVPSEGDEEGKGGGCFIATACYGNPMAGEVKTLCAFRDQYLVTNPIGRSLVKFYYSHSPKVADFIRDKEDLKKIVRACLIPFIWIISKVVK